MPTDNIRIIPTKIEKEVQERFLSYAMSVIIARALPLVNDGLKPVHRRILYAMYGLRLFHDKQYKKAARVVGEVIGKYHPHGDVAVYEAMTKMIQDFSANNPLIDGHGNFGSVDGDSPAAMRYTEVRLSALASEVLAGINHDTVDFVPNYDASEREPKVLPGLVPNLLVNGSIGIAVGMATAIPPHNLGEVLDTIVAYLTDENITVEEIVERKLLQGPDFPTGAYLINNKQNLIQSLKTGKGTYKIRAKYHLEEDGERQQIIIDQIPYQVNKTRLLENIIELVKNKRINHIADLRDESNRLGIRVVITLKKEAQVDIVLNQLFKLTTLQTNFSMNLLALHNNQPQIMNLLVVIKHYVDHQIDVLVRKTNFLFREDQKKLEILQAISKALASIDQVITLIKDAANQKVANLQLQKFLVINENQAKAILEMRLQRLTALEQDKVQVEIKTLETNISQYQKILASPQKQKELLIKKLQVLKKKYAKPRNTEIQTVDRFADLTEQDLILHKDVLVCLTSNNYLKRVDLSHFRHQHRGGVGVKGISLNTGDQIKHVFKVDTHDNLLFFTNLGKVYQLKTWKIPDLGRTAKGTPAQNLINIDPSQEKIESVVRIGLNYNKAEALFFVTHKGLVKRTKLDLFASINQSGKIAIKLNLGDRLRFVFPVQSPMSIIVGKSDNKIVHFQAKQVPLVGRAAKGVIGTRLTDQKKDYVVGASFASEGQKILSIASDGKGKLTNLDNYRITRRGAKGTFAVSRNASLEKKLVASLAVLGSESLLIAKSTGRFIMTTLTKTRITKSRSAKGVKLVNLEPGEKIMTVSIFAINQQ